MTGGENWTDGGAWKFKEAFEKAAKTLGLIKEVKDDGTIVFDGDKLAAFGNHYRNMQMVLNEEVPDKELIEVTWRIKQEEARK